MKKLQKSQITKKLKKKHRKRLKKLQKKLENYRKNEKIKSRTKLSSVLPLEKHKRFEYNVHSLKTGLTMRSKNCRYSCSTIPRI